MNKMSLCVAQVHGIKNVQQDHIKIIRTQVPLIGPGEKFRAASIKVDKDGAVATQKRKYCLSDLLLLL